MPPLWLIKAILIFCVLGDLLFMREYWVGTKGAWRHDVIGLTLMLEAMSLFATLTLIVLSVFFHLSRFTSESLAWVEDALLVVVGAVYWWRTYVFRQERNRPRTVGPEYKDK